MSLAFSRAPRKTAGNRMSRLLDAEEEDEFYKTTYGGFHDVSDEKSPVWLVVGLCLHIYADVMRLYFGLVSVRMCPVTLIFSVFRL